MRLTALRSQLHLARLLAAQERQVASRAAAMLHQVESFPRDHGLTRLDRLAQEIAAPRMRSRGGPYRAATGTWRTGRSRMAAEGRDRLTTRGRGTLARYVRAASDPELQRRFGSPRAQRALFATMARRVPGAVRLRVRGRHRIRALRDDGPRRPFADLGLDAARGWTRHTAAGRPAGAGGQHCIGVPDFLRMVSGARSAVAIVEQGLTSLEGDVILLGRLSEMFGRVRPSDLSALP